MSTISLNVLERFSLIQIVNDPSFFFPTKQISFEAAEFAKKLFLTEDEKVAIDYAVSPDARELFNAKKCEELVVEIEVSKELAASLSEGIEKKFEGKWTVAAGATFSPILEKLSEIK